MIKLIAGNLVSLGLVIWVVYEIFRSKRINRELALTTLVLLLVLGVIVNQLPMKTGLNWYLLSLAAGLGGLYVIARNL
ncbi:hypothetical protein [Lacticaseibacillus daqingensis]|uniref:hypothetical protein n=1 Tax=Lacticaseibacillus daqingensis TaxID=2486014 RepID=UPI000F795B00|nr:hypothetical protein [Lacticaseibacillus daqingensis]